MDTDDSDDINLDNIKDEITEFDSDGLRTQVQSLHIEPNVI